MQKKHKPIGLENNKKIARVGGNVALDARTSLEQKLGESVISKDNTLNYKYKDKKLLENVE